jgi:phage repressor protein C with HTH and peptisase S24 domain
MNSMTQRIHDKIRKVLETTRGLTQKGLAEHMGLNPAAVNRMLYGRRHIMAEEIPLIEEYIGQRLDLSKPSAPADTEYQQSARQKVLRKLSDVPLQPLSPAPPENAAAQMVPVYGYAACSLQNGLNLSNGDVVDLVTRHPAQIGISNAFAVYVFSDSMEPRYFRGELVYVHPGRPPEMKRDCLVEMQNGDAYIKRFLRQDEDKIRVAQFNPPEEKEIAKEDIKAIYAVVGRG